MVPNKSTLITPTKILPTPQKEDSLDRLKDPEAFFKRALTRSRGPSKERKPDVSPRRQSPLQALYKRMHLKNPYEE